MLSLRIRSIASVPLLILSPGLASAAGGPRGILFVCDSSSDRVMRLTDLNRSGFVEMDVPGEISVFYDDSSQGPDLSTPDHMVAGPSGSVLLLDGGTLDAVLALKDRNGDGDALDEGEVWTFYDASGGGPKLSTANTLIDGADGGYYVSDDGSGAHRILWLKDIDGDGDALEAGEVRVAYDASALSVPVLGDVESLAFAPDGRLFAADSTLQALFVLHDSTGDGDFLDEGEASLFFQGGEGTALADVESMAFTNGALHACDKASGSILRLEDLNGDGDASEAGEATLVVGEGSSLRVSSVNDFIPIRAGGFLVLDNSRDAVFGLEDMNGDGDALDAGEVYRWLVDDGSTLATPHGLVLLPEAEVPPAFTFIRGDTTGDRKLDISDPVATLGYLFLGRAIDNCIDALDSDDSGQVNISDPIFTLNYLFTGGASPPLPFPDAGPDPTADSLSC